LQDGQLNPHIARAAVLSDIAPPSGKSRQLAIGLKMAQLTPFQKSAPQNKIL
jgi:hypothetical protein